MLDMMYENIGSKLKNLAKWSFIVEAVGAVITGISLLTTDENYILSGTLTLVFGPIVAWVGSWILYAFGQLIEDVSEIRGKYVNNSDDVVKSDGIVEIVTSVPRTQDVKNSGAQDIPDKKLCMAKPQNFEIDKNLEEYIKALPTEEVYRRYSSGAYTEVFRYTCYLELKKREEFNKDIY